MIPILNYFTYFHAYFALKCIFARIFCKKKKKVKSSLFSPLAIGIQNLHIIILVLQNTNYIELYGISAPSGASIS